MSVVYWKIVNGTLVPIAAGSPLTPLITAQMTAGWPYLAMANRFLKAPSNAKPVKCEACEITLNSERQAKQHFEGVKHLKQLQKKKMPLPPELEEKLNKYNEKNSKRRRQESRHKGKPMEEEEGIKDRKREEKLLSKDENENSVSEVAETNKEIEEEEEKAVDKGRLITCIDGSFDTENCNELRTKDNNCKLRLSNNTAGNFYSALEQIAAKRIRLDYEIGKPSLGDS
ncbi:DgyrCDS1551 [Dimorphilus gyrociliatus]|uniref:DgyrCDS1551 n=1 Tax=Dimorphilus gyrociliatus TaxID=2664684 RepID=A0A7I8V9I2_9ANNE|nr:DgyrCDS1551 [Dimorphilus gyrociliatus]